MGKKHTYHKENCDSLIREIIVDAWGRTIVISGQHAFEYNITVTSITGIATTTKYQNGREARKVFQRYKRKKI